MYKFSYKLSACAILVSLMLFSCKKDKIDKEETPTPTTNRSELTKDSIFLYAKQVYLWNTSLPNYSSFKPRGYTDFTSQIDNFNAELFDITQFSKNPSTGKPYEYYFDDPSQTKYSYIDDSNADGQTAFVRPDQSAVDLDGKGNDLGYSLAVVADRTKNPVPFAVYFNYISPGSPAALAGLSRGDYIDEVNDEKFGTDYNAQINHIADIFNADPYTIKLGGVKKSGARFNITLTKATYTSSPIYKDTVITQNGIKVGYFAYARFSTDQTSFLDNIFTKFSNAGVSNLIIDLRYNGGGYVSTAEHMLNLIAPSSVDGKVMFAEHYNATMQKGKVEILKNQPQKDSNGNLIYTNGKLETYYDYSYTVAGNTFTFSKTGALNNIQKVVFIVSDRTASASELVINSLKPYVNMKIVGSTTYGKPVGFFPIRIDNYDVYFSLFSSKNANNEGDYYTGLAPDIVKEDDVTKDFGDPNELCMASALSYIINGSTASTSGQTMSLKGIKSNSSNLTFKNIFKPKEFIGMIQLPRQKK